MGIPSVSKMTGGRISNKSVKRGAGVFIPPVDAIAKNPFDVQSHHKEQVANAEMSRDTWSGNSNNYENKQKKKISEKQKMKDERRQLIDDMPTWGNFSDENKNINQPNADLKYNLDVYDKNGGLNSNGKMDASNYSLNNISDADGTRLSGNYSRDAELVGDLKQLGYQNYDPYRARAENEISEQANSNYQNTLESLRSQGGLSAADRLAAGKGRGRDMAEATANVNLGMSELESDNRYKTDMYNTDYSNQARFSDVNAINDANRDNVNNRMSQDQYNVGNQIDINKFNAGLYSDADANNATNWLNSKYKTADGNMSAGIANKQIQGDNYDRSYNQWTDGRNANFDMWKMKGNVMASGQEADMMYDEANKQQSPSSFLLGRRN